MTWSSVVPFTGRMRDKKFLTTLIVGLLTLLLLSPSMIAQVTKGSISGSVVDSTGAVVPDAQVTATSLQTGAVLTTTSDKAGYFRFNLIPPGTYTIDISKEGFKKTSQRGIAVTSGSDSGLGSITLGVGSKSETVEVTAGTEVLETTQSQVSSTFTSPTFQAVPGIGDNQGMDNLALFVPGVASSRDNSFSNSNGASFSVNGLRGRNNDQQIDGQNNNDNSVAGPGIFLSNQEFVSEYQIVTNNFGPEYGRNAGSVVNVVTKSGTNNIHGSIYGSENNSVLNALNNSQKLAGVTKQPRSNNEFAGFSIGGPIVKNKVFFFGGFDENIAISQTVYSSGSLTPTLNGIAQMAACFPGSTSVAALAKYGPYGITAGNPTPTNVTTKILQHTDSEGTTIVDCPSVEMGGINRTLSTPYHGFDWIFKVDYQGEKDTISARYLFNRGNYFNTNASPVTGYPSNVPALGQAVRTNWTRNLTSRMVNELSLTFSRLNVMFGGNSIGTVPTTGAMDQAVSSVSTGSGNLGFGVSNTYPQGRIVNTWQVQDNWNYMLGKHNLKAGINWTYQRSPNSFLPNLNGTFSFSNWDTFGRNLPSSISVNQGNPVLDFREYDTFLYFGDEWKLASNFTVNYGLTWTYYGQPANLFHTSDLARETGSTPFWNPAVPIQYRIAPALPSIKNSFGPSVGFAWTPGGALMGNGKTVLRGGYRRSYDPPFYNIYLNMASSAPQVLSQTLGGVIGLPSTPTGPVVRGLLSSYLATGVQDPRNFTQTSIDPNFGPDHVDSWSFGLQRELAKDTVVEARYVGNRARDLFQSINGNPQVSALAASYPNLVPSGVTACTSANAVVPAAVGRESCNQGRLRLRTNTGYSDYNGLQTEFRANNLFHQLLLRASYTWSKTTDNASEIFGSGGAGTTSAFSQNPWDYTKGEHGLSGLDIPQNFTLSFVEQFPFMKDQKGFLGHTVGGWAIAGSYILASGQPYNPIQYCIAYGGCGGGTVPDVGFNSSFSGYYDNLRPFVGSNSAPITAVGAYAGDVCNYWGGASCGLAATTLISWNNANATGDASTTAVTKDQVRYIVNAANSQSIFGTVYGNAGRNSVRDAKSNLTNASIYKTIRLSEKVKFDFHVTMNNVFNHYNYTSVDTWIDDAGNGGYYNEFGDPKFTDASGRVITFGGKIYW